MLKVLSETAICPTLSLEIYPIFLMDNERLQKWVFFKYIGYTNDQLNKMNKKSAVFSHLGRAGRQYIKGVIWLRQ